MGTKGTLIGRGGGQGIKRRGGEEVKTPVRLPPLLPPWRPTYLSAARSVKATCKKSKIDSLGSLLLRYWDQGRNKFYFEGGGGRGGIKIY